MIDFIMSNLATIVVGIVLLGVVSLSIRKVVKDKKNGVSACSSCSSKGGCGGGCH